MQLAQAIDAWLDAHGANLSASTQRDIAHIRDSVVETGWSDLPCDEVDRGIREDVIEEATKVGTLGGSAIGEFLTVVLAWAVDQPTIDDGLGPSGAFHAGDRDESPEDDDDTEYEDEFPDDDDDSDEYDDDDSDDDDSDDSDDDDSDDDDEWDDDDDEWDDSDDDDDSDDSDEYDDDDSDDDDTDDDDSDDSDDDDDDTDEYDDDDEFDDSDDDDTDEYDDDDEFDDSDDDDTDEYDDDERDPDDWVGILREGDDGFEGLAPENEPGSTDLSADEKAAASSFFDAIGNSDASERDSEPVVVLDDPPVEAAKGGVFSAAAEQIPPKPASGIDWITVAYFTVAAICFGLVIFFYLSS